MSSEALLLIQPADPMAALNNTARAYPDSASLPDLIAAWAVHTPEALAVGDGTRRLTYQALQDRAAAIAARLAAAGVAPGDRVGVCLGRSVETVAALLGVQMAGGAYVPLDPAYPAERLTLMVEDSGCTAILVDAATAARAPTGPIHIALEEVEAGVLPSRAAAEGLAYVIYTSGSTGRPKGVEVRHRNVVNLLHAMQRRLGFQAGQSWLAVTTISFDISVLEIFLPLVFGGAVVLAGGDDGEALMRRIAQVRPTILQATPATWRLLRAAGWHEDGSTTLLCGGEAVDPALAAWLVAQGGGRFWNVYGPTETTIWSIASEVREVRDRVPIGRPLDNTRLHILDEERRPVAAGQAGELYIGGEGVTRGYLGRQDLTSERFLPEPGHRGHRMYRTGDRVRLRPDGEVEFLGRMDDQVKVRGFRIEPGEVEAALTRHPQVAQAAVVAQADGEGDSRLTAFIVAAGVAAADLQAFAARTLPAHMAPDRIVQVETLPLTPNGKIDRLALASRTVQGRAAVAPPRDDLERTLVEVFETALSARDIGVDDDFFALGGTSLGAVRVVSQIERRLGRRLHLNVLHHGAPTVAALARILRGDASEALPHLLPLGGHTDDGRADPIFCLHTMVEGTVFFYQALARRLGARERLLGVLPRGLHDGGQGDTSFQTLAEHAVSVIRARQPYGPYRLLGFSSAGTLAMETARRLKADGEVVQFLGLIDAYPPVGRRTWRFGWTIQTDRLRRLREAVSDRLQRRARGVGPGASDAGLRLRHRLAVRGYRARPYAGDAALFVSRETTRMFAQRGLGWSRLVADLSVDELDGGHYSLVNEPGVEALAGRVQARLSRAG